MIEWPSLPVDLHFLLTVERDELVLPSLLERGEDFVALFLEGVTDEKSWLQSHLDLIDPIFEWATKRGRVKSTPIELLSRIVVSIHKQHALLSPLLKKDLHLRVKDYETSSCSLLYAAQSGTLRTLIQSSEEEILLCFDDVPVEVFKVIDRFIYGEREDFWRFDLDFLLCLLLRAGQWDIPSFVKEISRIISRYIERENAVNFLRIGQKYVIPEFKQVCCEAINQFELGVYFTSLGESELTITVENSREALPILQEVSSITTHLNLCGESANSREIKQLLPHFINLRAVDMRRSTDCDLQLFHTLSLKELNLSACSWLSDLHIREIVTHLPDLITLQIAENDQLGYESFKAIADLKKLQVFSCMGCGGLKDDHITMLLRSCVDLHRLNISWSAALTDRGLEGIGVVGGELTEIDITHCIKVTDSGIRNLVRPLQKLLKLTMANLPLVTEEGIYNVVALCPSLKLLDLGLFALSAIVKAKMQKRSPWLKIVYQDRFGR